MNYEWELRITPVDYWERHPNAIFAEDDGEISTMRFKKLTDVFNFVGVKLKRERCGYSGIVNGNEYVVMKV